MYIALHARGLRERVAFSLINIVLLLIVAHVDDAEYYDILPECNSPTSRIFLSHVIICIQPFVPFLSPPIGYMPLPLAHIWLVTWQELRELKSEIEHIQRLLEKGR